MKVDVIIEKDESGYYVAEVPAFPGCFSQGKTMAESKKNIKEAIQGWIEVMEGKYINKRKLKKKIAIEV
jgi:predicted RNase H-like HicB family nuclease